MRIATTILASSLLAVGCASFETRQSDVIRAYQQVEREASGEGDRAERSWAAAEAENRSATEGFPEMEGTPSVRAARDQAEAAIKAVRVRSELRKIAAEVTAGKADQNLEQRLASLYSEADRAGARPDLERLRAAIEEQRGRRECPPLVEPLLAAGKLAEAREKAFYGPCTPELRVKVARAFLARLRAEDPCEAAAQGISLAWNRPAVDAALAADPMEQIAAAVLERLGSAGADTCVAKLEKPAALSEFAPQVGARMATVFTSLERRRAQAASAAAQLAIDEAGKKPVVARLRARLQEIKGRLPIAAALLQKLARGYGDPLEIVPQASLASPNDSQRRFPGFMFDLPFTPPDCPDLKLILGRRVNSRAVRNDGGWIVLSAACGRSSGVGKTITEKSTRIEYRSVARQVPSGDGVTTRTVFVNQPFEVSTEATYQPPANGPWWISLRVVSSLDRGIELSASASAQDVGEFEGSLTDNLRKDLANRYRFAAEARDLADHSARMNDALRQLDSAKTDDEREEAMANLAAVTRGKDKSVLEWFVQKYKLPDNPGWPW